MSHKCRLGVHKRLLSKTWPKLLSIWVPLSRSQIPRCQFLWMGFHSHCNPLTCNFRHNMDSRCLRFHYAQLSYIRGQTERTELLSYLYYLMTHKTSAAHHRMFWPKLQNKNTNKCMMFPEMIQSLVINQCMFPQCFRRDSLRKRCNSHLLFL